MGDAWDAVTGEEVQCDCRHTPLSCGPVSGPRQEEYSSACLIMIAAMVSLLLAALGNKIQIVGGRACAVL